ncbi:hypothetical protein LTR70_006155 [Exophiala xenobiotica]|nr:hypothetical protein LTR70_006155 [Exophiala xenobiotica]
MGRNKHDHSQRRKPIHQSTSTSSGIKRRQHSQNGKLSVSQKKLESRKSGKPGHAKQPLKPKVPFSKHDRVLLVGEGDFSFSFSLAKHYEVASILSMSYDDIKTVLEKYPEAEQTLYALKHATTVQTRTSTRQEDDNDHEQDWNGFSSDDEGGTSPVDEERLKTTRLSILHGVDATAISKKHKKLIDPYAPFTKIVFNFPHTGGLTTDVNRQVRANQELLVGFFNASKPYLATQARPAVAIPVEAEDNDPEDDSQGGEVERQTYLHALSSGQILVTLFEGEPYTLWNIRDLARHCGLQVIESFKFPWAAYPGYEHARTIGDITTGKDRSGEGKRKGAWRGEERDARCYVLGLKDEPRATSASRKKRKLRDESDDSE